MYKFDATTVNLVFIEDVDYIAEGAGIDAGTGDLSIDTGSRDDTGSTIDQGLR
jgi:hypothetical protein